MRYPEQSHSQRNKVEQWLPKARRQGGMENRRVSVWKDEISLSFLQRYHDRGFLQHEIPTLSKSRQPLFIVKTVSKNRRKRPHLMTLLHPWHQKGKTRGKKRKTSTVAVCISHEYRHKNLKWNIGTGMWDMNLALLAPTGFLQRRHMRIYTQLELAGEFSRDAQDKVNI